MRGGSGDLSVACLGFGGRKLTVEFRDFTAKFRDAGLWQNKALPFRCWQSSDVSPDVEVKLVEVLSIQEDFIPHVAFRKRHATWCFSEFDEFLRGHGVTLF